MTQHDHRQPCHHCQTKRLVVSTFCVLRQLETNSTMFTTCDSRSEAQGITHTARQHGMSGATDRLCPSTHVLQASAQAATASMATEASRQQAAPAIADLQAVSSLEETQQVCCSRVV